MLGPNTINYLILLGLFLVIIGASIYQLKKYRAMRVAALREQEKRNTRNEKLAMAKAFSSELKENRFKCESFITIYSELLHNLREFDRKASYEQSGSFIHQHLPLSRGVFDENKDKLALLGPKLAESLTRIYANIYAEAQYFALEPTTPRAVAVRHVETVLEETQKILDPLDSVKGALNVIIRDGMKNEREQE